MTFIVKNVRYQIYDQKNVVIYDSDAPEKSDISVNVSLERQCIFPAPHIIYTNFECHNDVVEWKIKKLKEQIIWK